MTNREWGLWTVHTPCATYTRVQASSEYHAKIRIFRQTLGRIPIESMTAVREGCA